MATQGGDVQYTMSLKDLLSGAIGKAKTATAGLDNQILKTQNSLSGLAGKIGAFVSIYTAFDFAKDSVKAFNEEAQEIAGLQAILKSTGGAAGQTMKGLNEMATAIQKTTTFTDDMALASESVLLKFSNIRGEVFQRTIPVLADLATKMKTTMPEAANFLGKALNDPTTAMRFFKEMGITLTDKQKDMMEQMTKTGRVAEVQAFILDEVGKKTKGLAEVAAKTGLGPLKMLANRFEDVKEMIGELILKGLNKLMPHLTRLVEKLKVVVEWMGNHKELLKATAKLVLDLGIAYGIWWTVMKGYSIFTAITGAIGLLTAAYRGATIARTALTKASTAGAVSAGLEASAATIAANAVGMKSIWGDIGVLLGKWIASGLSFTLSKLGALAVSGAAAAGMTAALVLKPMQGMDAEQIKKMGGGSEVEAQRNFYKELDKKINPGKYKSGYNIYAKDYVAPTGWGLKRPTEGTDLGGLGTDISKIEGTKATTINITIGNLIEKFNITTQNMTESASKIKQMVSQALIEVVKDSQVTAGT